MKGDWIAMQDPNTESDIFEQDHTKTKHHINPLVQKSLANDLPFSTVRIFH
jgi:hypothetical protein